MNPIFLGVFIFIILISGVIAQQGYSRNSVLNCDGTDGTEPSTAFLYSCNGEISCQAFLIFKAQPPYTSLTTISNLTSSNPSELGRLNNVSMEADFPIDKEVIVPVSCSCSGQYYQANSTYVIPSDEEDTYFTIANYTYQGLTTCNSLMGENPYDERALLPGFRLRVPLRCACPTSTQISNGTKYLLTYSVYWRDSVPDISERFNASEKSVLDANGFSENDPIIYPFTTLLIPLLTEPSSSQTITHSQPKSPPSSTSNSKNHKSKKGVYVVVGSASLVLLIFVVLAAVLFYRKIKLGRTKGKKWVLPEDLLVGIATAERVLKLFAFQELVEATNNFDSNSNMKGSVYRGVLNGQVVAIKKMNKNVWKEVKILNKINHFNLIRLYGVCRDDGFSYLVYEYMEKGSLRDWLRKKTCPSIQNWFYRVQIALDVANGLHYLHNFTNPAYVHKDINSSNVLLNGDLRAKIANFGLASSANKRENGFGSSKFMGTIGYMAPEYIETGAATPKIDVYAFGVILLELLSGKNVIMMCDGKEILLSAVITSIMEGDNEEAEICDFMDPLLRRNYPRDLALSVAKLSVTCLSRDPESRPSMYDVVSTLVKIQTDTWRCESSYIDLD